MFYPFCQLTDLDLQKKYWKKNHQELTKHNKKENTIFWKKGFGILQNIQDRDTFQKQMRRARDPICMVTVNKKPDKKNTQSQSELTKQNNVKDILEVGNQMR